MLRWILCALATATCCGVSCSPGRSTERQPTDAPDSAGMGRRPSTGGAAARSDSGRDAAEPSTPRLDGGREGSRDAAEPVVDAESLEGAAGATRPFLLTSAGAQLLTTGPDPGLQLTEANLADDVDLVAVHLEYYGVPWEAFTNGTAPPAEWTAKMRALADHAHSVSSQLFLSISMLNGTRQTLAARTVIENGRVKSEDNWAPRCYDFARASDGAARRQAYVRYVEHMVDLFEPSHLNLAIEVNLFFEQCPDAVAGVVEVSNAAYAASKAKDPALIAFPSFQIDHLYGHSEDSCPPGDDKGACFDRNYQQIANLERDRFAMSSYPYLNDLGVEDLPRDWFARGPARGGERGLIAETGWLSTDLVARNGATCTTVIRSDEEAAAAYLSRVLADAEALPLELVTWWADRDLLPSELMTRCPCDYEPTWCQVVDIFRSAGGGPLMPAGQFVGEVLMKAFGTMGLRDYDGASKSALAPLWNAARVRSFEP